MQRVIVAAAIVGTVVAVAPARAAAQGNDRERGAVTFCVTPPDSNWRPVSLGFDTENRLRVDNGETKTLGYPVIRNVERGSVADSAGLRDGDVWRAVDHHDFLKEPKLAKVHGPGVPIVLTIARGDSVFDRTVTPGKAKPSRCNSTR